MILARCPACGTTFRVRPEQVQARAGRVRCGHCKHAFNALEARLDDEPLAPVAAAAPVAIEPPLFVLEEKVPPEVTEDASGDLSAPDADEPAVADPAADDAANADLDDFGPETPADDVIDASGDAPPENTADVKPQAADEAIAAPDTFDIESLLDDAPAEFGDPEPDAVARVEPFAAVDIAEEWPPVEADDIVLADAPARAIEAPAFQPDWPDAAELDLKPAPDDPIDFDSLLHKQDLGAPPALAASPDEQPWPASEEPAAMLAQPRSGLAPRIEPGDDDDDEAPVARVVAGDAAPTAPIIIDAADDEPAPQPLAEPDAPAPALHQAAWAAGATLLVLALLAQAVLVFRSEIVQSSPQMRPFMESLCAGLGCELPLPRNAAEIAIESSDIQPDATREAFFTLHATLRNRADYAQAYPHLEITLTDARDKALVRKVLEPAQWLPADASREAFPAQREVSTRIGFEAPGVAAAGYRVYVFYP